MGNKGFYKITHNYFVKCSCYILLLDMLCIWTHLTKEYLVVGYDDGFTHNTSRTFSFTIQKIFSKIFYNNFVQKYTTKMIHLSN